MFVNNDFIHNKCFSCGEQVKDRFCVVKGCKKETLLYSKSFCKIHYLTYLAYRCLGRGTYENAKLLEELLEKQNWKCYYTGEFLILGKNTSIEHKIPISRGGENKIENLAFVIPLVNFWKGRRTEQEFLNLVRRIYLHRITT